jgi:hypothetical protein
MFVYYLILLNLFHIILSEAKAPERKCNILYYGTVDKIMMNTQNQRTKQVMESFYKKRSKQTGMSIGEIKNCYNSKIKTLVKP